MESRFRCNAIDKSRSVVWHLSSVVCDALKLITGTSRFYSQQIRRPPPDLLPSFHTKASMISSKLNRSHSLSQTKLETLGRGSRLPFFEAILATLPKRMGLQRWRKDRFIQHYSGRRGLCWPCSVFSFKQMRKLPESRVALPAGHGAANTLSWRSQSEAPKQSSIVHMAKLRSP